MEERATIVLLPQGRSTECPLMADAVESYFHNVEFIITCACAGGYEGIEGGAGACAWSSKGFRSWARDLCGCEFRIGNIVRRGHV